MQCKWSKQTLPNGRAVRSALSWQCRHGTSDASYPWQPLFQQPYPGNTFPCSKSRIESDFSMPMIRMKRSHFLSSFVTDFQISARIKPSRGTEVCHGCLTCPMRVGFFIRSRQGSTPLDVVQVEQKTFSNGRAVRSSCGSAATEPVMLRTLGSPSFQQLYPGNNKYPPREGPVILSARRTRRLATSSAGGQYIPYLCLSSM